MTGGAAAVPPVARPGGGGQVPHDRRPRTPRGRRATAYGTCSTPGTSGGRRRRGRREGGLRSQVAGHEGLARTPSTRPGGRQREHQVAGSPVGPASCRTGGRSPARTVVGPAGAVRGGGRHLERVLRGGVPRHGACAGRWGHHVERRGDTLLDRAGQRAAPTVQLPRRHGRDSAPRPGRWGGDGSSRSRREHARSGCLAPARAGCRGREQCGGGLRGDGRGRTGELRRDALRAGRSAVPSRQSADPDVVAA